MKSRNAEQKLTEGKRRAKKPRFKIEKLEERIAPAKGGIPGPPDNSNGGGNGGAYNYHGCRHGRTCGR